MRTGRARTAVAAAMATLACSLGAAGPAAADHPLEPDLVTIPLNEDRLDLRKKTKTRTLLWITNEVGNQGAGPLEITPSPPSPQCVGETSDYPVFTAVQTVYEDSNDNAIFERGTDTESSPNEIGCLVFHDHPKHNHWHVLDFSKYSLRSEATGSMIESRKVGFCLLDGGTPFDFEVPGMPAGGSYSGGDCGSGDSNGPPGVMGISVGFSDIYGVGTPGQQIRVDDLPRGRYCVTSSADPLDNLIESNNTNNTNEIRIRLNPEKLRVKALVGPCVSG